MKVLLIFPRIEHGASTFRDKDSWESFLFGYPILTLPHLAGITPKKYEVRIVNENLEKVVLGGYHPTAMPDEAGKHADSIVLGMAEASWPRLLKDAENGKLKPIYERDTDFDMADVPPIRRDLITHNPLQGAIQTTRGCTNRCEFCAISSFCQHGIKQRPIKNVVEEIKQIKELIKQKVRKSWVANGTTNVLGTVDDEWLTLAHKSGCVEWFVGFESVSQAALDSIKKTHNKVENFKKMIKRIHDYGMTIQGGIIFGFDEDTPDIFDTTIEKLNELEIDVLEVNILTPYPGTPLYDKMEREGRLTTKDWSRYNQVDVVFTPKQMTEKELSDGARKVAKEFYSWSNIIRRNLKIFATTKKVGGMIPAGTNINFRRYYKRDFSF